MKVKKSKEEEWIEIGLKGRREDQDVNERRGSSQEEQRVMEAKNERRKGRS